MKTFKSNTENILIIDDRQENLQALSNILHEQGYQVRQAINAELALKAVRKSPPDLMGTFPQALLDKLHDELLPRHQEISEVMSADEMIAFAEAIIAVGDAFTIPPLKYYGEELLRYIKVFDVINIKRLLGFFPEIVEIINTIFSTATGTQSPVSRNRA